MTRLFTIRAHVALLAALLIVCLGGCESLGSLGSLGKRIDYKSAASAPSLELPPDLSAPQYDDRFAVNSASQFAARNAGRPKQAELLPVVSEARIARAGNERWLVVKTTPEQAWSQVRKFWTDLGKYIDVFYSTYKRDKFRTRIERGAEPGTVEVYVSHRGMEQVPTAKVDNVSPAGFAWAVMPLAGDWMEWTRPEPYCQVTDGLEKLR